MLPPVALELKRPKEGGTDKRGGTEKDYHKNLMDVPAVVSAIHAQLNNMAQRQDELERRLSEDAAQIHALAEKLQQNSTRFKLEINRIHCLKSNPYH